MSPLIPPPLKPGDRIGVAAPAGPVRQSAVEAGMRYLRERGYRPESAPHLLDRFGYLAGTDDDRLDDLNRMIADDDLAAVWFARGGYGSGRIVDRVDLGPLRDRPKALVGYSDMTMLFAAARRSLDLVTYYGPMVTDLGTPARFDPASLWSMVGAAATGSEYDISSATVLRRGSGRGPLLGGCLSLLVSLLGTPWDLQTDGAILYWEEVNEEPYRIDRMLGHLKNAGKLARLKGMVVGSLVNCRPADPAAALSIADIVRTHLAGTDYPVMMDLPSGHAEGKLTLALGRPVRMTTEPPRLAVLAP